jgi:hypothetical protein
LGPPFRFPLGRRFLGRPVAGVPWPIIPAADACWSLGVDMPSRGMLDAAACCAEAAMAAEAAAVSLCGRIASWPFLALVVGTGPEVG